MRKNKYQVYFGKNRTIDCGIVYAWNKKEARILIQAELINQGKSYSPLFIKEIKD